MRNRFQSEMVLAVDRVVERVGVSDPVLIEGIRQFACLSFIRGALHMRTLQGQIAEATAECTQEAYGEALEALDNELDACVYSEPSVMARLGRAS